MVHQLFSVSAATLLLLSSTALAGDEHRRNNRLSAVLKPTEEVPALSSTASGRFKVRIDDQAQSISFELSYAGLEAAPTQAHIHIGQRRVNGAISVFLCGPAPAAAQTCPVAPATVTGVLTPANIIGPAAQGIDPATDAANGFEELVRLLRSGVTYANVHSSKFPGGEIRGQIRPDRH
jgi:hypothetical protein